VDIVLLKITAFGKTEPEDLCLLECGVSCFWHS